MGSTINKSITTELHYKDIALISVAFGLYIEKWKGEADNYVIQRMNNLVNRLGTEMADTSEEVQEMYYVRNEGTIGNAAIWWARNSKGYTSDITNAHRFTREEAEELCKRKEDSAYKCSYIDGLETAKKVIIDIQYMSKEEQLWN